MSLKHHFHEAAQLELLTTGLGLSDRGVPLRLPALIVPGLLRLQDHIRQDRPARYVIYQATDFIIETNRLDAQKARRNAEKITLYLKGFVDRFFPQLANHVNILTQDQCRVKEEDLRHVEAMLDDSACAEEIALISSYGRNHAGNFRRYAAANVLLNGGCAGRYPLSSCPPDEKTTITLIGGQKEVPFFNLTIAMARATGCTHGIRAEIVDTGKMPAYYPCPDGDLLIGDDHSAFKAPRRIKNDFQRLEKIGADIPALREIAHISSPELI